MPPKIYNAQNAKRANRAYVLRGASAQSATAKPCSTTMGRAKKGGRRWSPPGGYNKGFIIIKLRDVESEVEFEVGTEVESKVKSLSN